MGKILYYFLGGIIFLILSAGLMAQGAVASSDNKAVKIVIEGTVFDQKTNEPLSHATIMIIGSGQGTTTNSNGRFRLVVRAGSDEIRISHIGYFSEKVAVGTESVTRDIYLKPQAIDMGRMKAYTRALDPGQRIIAEAIRRKKDILALFDNYSYDASTRLVLTDPAKRDSSSVMIIAETQTTSYWEQPDKYKEVITARKQSANLTAEANLITMGEMLNFNQNRLPMNQYSIVSPTAEDALDFYNYYLLDTVYIDDHAVFMLEMEPRNEYQPLLTGTIYIADSSYEVVQVDCGFSKGVSFTMVKEARYFQYMALVKNGHYLPVKLGFTARIDLGLPFPGIPTEFDFSFIASIYDYRIEEGIPDDTFDEYEIVVDKGADDFDSASWDARQTIPLTEIEEIGYQRLDSIAAAPKPLGKKILMGMLAATFLASGGAYDLFHYNRVEGYYLGLGAELDNLLERARLYFKTGYAFEDHRWQYKYNLSFLLWKKQKVWIGGRIGDEIVHRPTIIAPSDFNPTFYAKLCGIDPYDYYREKGYSLFGKFKIINHTQAKAAFNDQRHLAKPNQINHNFFRDFNDVRQNQVIDEGKLRSVEAQFTYDSRRLINNKGEDWISFARQYLILTAGGEYSSPDFLDSDFHFRKYFTRLEARVRLLNLGMTTINAYAGASDYDLPAQRLFIADFYDPGFYRRQGMNTMGDANFGGDRIAIVYATHYFGPFMFRNLRGFFLQKIPFGFQIHGGALWTDFKDGTYQSYDENIKVAPTAYSEIGFGLSNLTPFLGPFNFSVQLTWQLSAYRTNKLMYSFNFEF